MLTIIVSHWEAITSFLAITVPDVLFFLLLESYFNTCHPQVVPELFPEGLGCPPHLPLPCSRGQPEASIHNHGLQLNKFVQSPFELWASAVWSCWFVVPILQIWSKIPSSGTLIGGGTTGAFPMTQSFEVRASWNTSRASPTHRQIIKSPFFTRAFPVLNALFTLQLFTRFTDCSAVFLHHWVWSNLLLVILSDLAGSLVLTYLPKASILILYN